MLSFVTPIFCVYRDASNNVATGLVIGVDGVGVEAKLNMKGKVNFNSNDNYGIFIGRGCFHKFLKIFQGSDTQIQ